MRMSDWSSDVCSSDLERPISTTSTSREAIHVGKVQRSPPPSLSEGAAGDRQPNAGCEAGEGFGFLGAVAPLERSRVRSEWRRVGKACVSKCISRVWQLN